MGHSLLNEKSVVYARAIPWEIHERSGFVSNRIVFWCCGVFWRPVFSIFVAGSFGVSTGVWRLQKCCHRSRSRPGGYAPIHFELGKVQETRLHTRGRMVSPLEQMLKDVICISWFTQEVHRSSVLRRWMRGYCRNLRA